MISRADQARLRVAFADDPVRLAVLELYIKAETMAGVAADAADQFKGTVHHATTQATATYQRGHADGLGKAVVELLGSLPTGPLAIARVEVGAVVEFPGGRYGVIEFWTRTPIGGFVEFGGKAVERNDPPAPAVPPARNERLWPVVRSDAATPVPAAYRCDRLVESGVCDTVLDIMGRCERAAEHIG